MEALERVQAIAAQYNLGRIEKAYKRMLRGYWLTKPDGKEVYLAANADMAVAVLQGMGTTILSRRQA